MTEESGFLNSLRGTTKGEAVSREAEETLLQYNLQWHLLSCYNLWW